MHPVDYAHTGARTYGVWMGLLQLRHI